MATDWAGRFGAKVGYDEEETERFREGGHRVRHVERLARASRDWSIEVEIVGSRHCNSGHIKGQKLLLDADGNFITRHCPKRICVYLASQLALPVALINERLSEGLPPGDFHFTRMVRCMDVGVERLGYGEVLARVRVVPREAEDKGWEKAP